MRRLTALLLVIAACAPPKPPPPTVTVAATSDTVIAPAVEITAAVPRSDGKWVLLAPLQDAVMIADFSARTAVPFPGITKADVPHPITLIGVGDSVVIGDWGLRRFTMWTPDGHRVAAWPAPDSLRGALPRARDAAGQWYFQISPEPRADGSGLLDSSAVVRADAQLVRFDTVARLAPSDLVKVNGPSGEHYQRRIMSGDDIWGVTSDGSVWVARVFQNRLEWYRRGEKKPVRSPLLPDQVLMLSDMDRELYVQRFPEDQRDAVRDLPNSPVKPPFERAFAAPDGRIWLAKSDTALAPVRHMQLVDRNGVYMVVAVPSRGSLLGIDGTSILMAEEFPGGVRVMRYPVPPQVKGSQPPQ